MSGMRPKDNARSSLAMSHSRRGAPASPVPFPQPNARTAQAVESDDSGKRLLLRILTSINGLGERFTRLEEEISEIRAALNGSGTANEPDAEETEEPEQPSRGGK